MGRIVVGVDGSEGAAAALRWAVQEGGYRRDATVVAVLAWSLLDQHHPDGRTFSPTYGPTEARQALAIYVERARAGEATEAAEGEAGVAPNAAAAVELEVVNDLPARALLDASARADLLVVGARGLGGFRGLLLGSVSQQCAHHAPCPVVIIRPQPEDD
jgi:nucleotide-binding universal stress UspA family protein